jgi:hypothetical protein
VHRLPGPVPLHRLWKNFTSRRPPQCHPHALALGKSAGKLRRCWPGSRRIEAFSTSSRAGGADAYGCGQPVAPTHDRGHERTRAVCEDAEGHSCRRLDAQVPKGFKCWHKQSCAPCVSLFYAIMLCVDEIGRLGIYAEAHRLGLQLRRMSLLDGRCKRQGRQPRLACVSSAIS